MTDHLAGLIEQLHAEIGAIVDAVAELLGPAAHPLGLLVDAGAAAWAGRLLGQDDVLAAQTARDLMRVRWPEGTEPPTRWWGTPLGWAVIATGGHPAEVISYAQAGAVLGCTRQGIAKMVTRGYLGRGDGSSRGGPGVTVASVRERIRRDHERTGAGVG